jgi:hypothetical protein
MLRGFHLFRFVLLICVTVLSLLPPLAVDEFQLPMRDFRNS